jgi:CRP-like cAMP-binding protein
MTRNLQEVLAEQKLFHGMTQSYMELIAGCGSNVRFNEGDWLFREGEPANSFYLIRHGRVSLEMHVPQHGSVTLETIMEGDVVGWSWLFPPYKWHLDARAVVLTRAMAFDGECLRRKCDEDPALGYDVMKRFASVMIDRLKTTYLQLLDVYGHRG